MIPKSVLRIGKQLLDRLFENKKNELPVSAKAYKKINGNSEYVISMVKGAKGTRLNRIARDLNVGIATIVEFLNKKGLDIDANPNSKVPAEYYDLLLKEYSSDSEIKKESEKLMHSIRMKKETITLESQDTPEESDITEVVEDAASEEPVQETEVVEETLEPDTIVTETPGTVDDIIVDADIKEEVSEQEPIVEKLDTPQETTKPEEAIADESELEPATTDTSSEEEIVEEKPETEEIVQEEQPKDDVVEQKDEDIPQPEAIKEEPTEISEKEPPIAEEVEDTVLSEETDAQTETIPSEEIEAEPVDIPEATTTEETQTVEAEDQVEEPVEMESDAEEKAEEPAVPDEESAVSEDKEEAGAPGEFKVIGKIDLSTINQKTRPSKKSRKEKEIERQIKEKAKKDAQSEWKKKVQKIHSPETEKKAAKESAKSKTRKKPAKQSEETQEDFIKTDVKKLSGPTVVGKIDLPQKEKKKGKAKPVASSTGDDNQVNKKRRKRIKKERVDITDKKTPKPTDRTSKKPRPKKRTLKKEVSEEDVQKQIKDTLARLTTKGKSKAAKHRRTKRDDIKARQLEDMEKEEMEKNILKVSEFVSVNELATMMDIPVNQIIATCMSLGMFVSINQRLDAETMTLVADEFGYEVQFTSIDIEEELEEQDNEEDLFPRPPIVTVMGHVDHGKTSLLDYIRKANVIAGEAGGITQHIGAYSVELSSGKHITFLDTPGHEAFTAMRARGAKVTDIAIIVVAADDNVMPQTIEAINHASAAGVPIVFAVNKVDKPGANPEKIKEELANMNYLVEDWGGKYQSQEISAKFGNNVEDLLEKVLLEAEMLDLKGNPHKAAHGTIIESSLDKGRGYVATILVQSGNLQVGDIILAGSYSGHVKAMFNERGNKIEEAGPSVPALILGLNGAPQAGDNFHVMTSEREAREIANKREQLMREQSLRTQKHITLDEIGRRLALGDFHEINIIVKGDVDGSIEALSDALIKLSTDAVQVNIKHKAVGQISESDIMLAMASNAIVIGFQVRPSISARKLAEKEQIDIRLYSIIYDAINEMRDAMEGMLSPDLKEEIIASLEIRETFKITKVGTIAGCIVKEGKINRNSRVRLIREGIVIYTGELGSLRRFKEDVKEVANGYECGLNIANFNDIKVGDIVEAFTEVEVKKKL